MFAVCISKCSMSRFERSGLKYMDEMNLEITTQKLIYLSFLDIYTFPAAFIVLKKRHLKINERYIKLQKIHLCVGLV